MSDQLETFYKGVELAIDLDYYEDEHWMTINKVEVQGICIYSLFKFCNHARDELIRHCLKEIKKIHRKQEMERGYA